jgi:glycosyltransferase involved in cell wall biosynthesis
VKILQLSARLPYPLTDGGAIGIYHLARSIAEKGNDVTFVSFPLDDVTKTNEAIDLLSMFCKVRLVSKPLPSRFRTLVRTVFKGAYPIERRMMSEMFELLEHILTTESFDIVHLDHSHVGKYGLWIKRRFGLPVILRQHNFETSIYDRFAQNEKNTFKRLIALLHAKRLRVEETRILRGVDAVAAITSEDVALMREVAPDVRYRVIPAGVDVEYFKPDDKIPSLENEILWVGGMEWEPNRDALAYFLDKILPRIAERLPKFVFDVVGSGTDRLKSLGVYGDRIRLHGIVPDIRPFVLQAGVIVVPLRVGGGMRVKLLEFFAMGKAVVATPIAAEGNKSIDNKEVILQANPFEFADAVIDLLGDVSKRSLLGANARRLVEAQYSWQHIGKQLCALYAETLQHKGRVVEN